MNVGSWSELSSKLSPNAIKNLALFDTTLRDGAQTRGLNLSLDDKLSISKKLSDFGMNYIEGGWPTSNPRDMEYFREVKSLGLKCKIAAFGMTSRNPPNDELISGLVKTEADTIAVFGKAWDLHVRDVLKITNDENLSMIADTIDYLKSHGFEVVFDAEHYLDGHKNNPDYALETLKAAKAADCIVIADTNGGALPWEVDDAFVKAKEVVKNDLGIHAHNDSGFAVMNTLVALANGANHVQGTMNGLGERCGNADWMELLPTLGLKLGIETGVDMKGLKKLSRYIERMTGFSVPRNKPFVGLNAFSHKGGVHIDAMLKNPRTYEHMNPEEIGNSRVYSMSEQVGRSGVVDAAKRHGYALDKESDEVKKLTEMVKERQGATDAEMFLMITKLVDNKKEPFNLLGYETEVSSTGNAKSEVKIVIGDETVHEISEGVGPVHAMDLAMRKALGKKFEMGPVALSNFRVRIVNQEKATAAQVEVFIEFRANGDAWSVSGVSDDIIKASEEALIKGYKYYLLKR